MNQTFKAGDRVFKTDEETLAVLKSVYNTDPENKVFRFVVQTGLRNGSIKEV